MKHSMDGMHTMDTGGLVRITHLNEFWDWENSDDSNMSKYDVLDKMVRQGDIVLYPIDELPKYAQLQYSPVLAWGEKSGHKHILKGGQVEVYETMEPEEIRLLSMAKVAVKKFVKVLETSMLQPTMLVHEDKKGQKADHDSKKIQQGTYAVLQEQEFSPFEEEIKPVVD